MKVNENAQDGYLIDIDGRTGGFISWCLTLIGFDAVSSLKVTASEVTFKGAGLHGQKHVVTPLTSLAHTECGYSKPIGYLIVGTIFIFGGILEAMMERGNGGIGSRSIAIFLIGVGFMVAYWLLKKMFIFIETYGGATFGLVFKRSVIENVSVDIKKAIQAIHLINIKVLEAQGLQSTMIMVAEATRKPLGVCPECNFRNDPEDAFCSQCGKRLGG